MNAITSLVKRNALVTFFVLAYAISWSFFLLSKSVPGFPPLFPFGSVIAAVIVASVTGGWGGLKELVGRCLRWRVGLRWYAAALLVPAAMGLAVIALNTMLGGPLPTLAQLGPWYGLLLMFPMAMIDAPLQENSGWHGFAMPRFSADRSPLVNTLILGVLLAGWHAPLALSEGGIAVPYLVTTILSAFVTNWVYYNADESALLAILYHTAANTVGIFTSQMLAGTDMTRYYWLLAGVNCVVAVAVVLFDAKTWRSRGALANASIETVRRLA